MNYAAPVWMTNRLKSRSWEALNRAHRFKDRTSQMHRVHLNHQSKRATATQWAKYSATKMLPKSARASF